MVVVIGTAVAVGVGEMQITVKVFSIGLPFVDCRLKYLLSLLEH